MIFSIAGLLIALFIALGRQISVILKIKAGLWFFPHFEVKESLQRYSLLRVALRVYT
ncbi:MAG: hypothetical protein ACOCXT_02865 [Candidatus Dojkabacteria bacterium]